MIKITLVFCIIAIALAKSRKGLLPKERVNTIVTKILSQYPDYDVIIHMDNRTSQEAYTFEDDLFNSFQGTLVQNYDVAFFFNRPVGYKTMFNFEYNDVILILSRDTISNETVSPNVKILPFWQQQGLDSAGSVFVLDLTTSDLYHECFYCGSMSSVLAKISSGEAIPTVRDYLNDFTNFHGHHFKIAYMPYLPFFWCEKSPTGCSVYGSEGQLLQVLSETLNFQYSLENFEDYVGGEWRAMVDAVHYKRLDWAVGGISSSPERGQLTDLTRSIHTEVYTVLFHSSSFNSNWKKWRQLLLPFKLSLWLCVYGMLFFMTLLLKAVPDYVGRNASVNLFKFFEMSIRGLVEQPMVRIPVSSMAKRFLLISWWYVAIIIATAYRSKLASSLIHPDNVQPRSILELLSDGYSFQVNHEDWTVLRENLEGSVEHERAYSEILKKMNDDLNICSSVQHAVDHKVAVVDEATTLQYEVITICRSLLLPEDFANLRVIEEEVFPSFHVWPLQLSAPYRHKFSELIENLHASGILTRWYNLASKKQLPVSNHYTERNSAVALTMSTMTAPLLILSIGFVLATVAFLCELTYFTLSNLINFYKEHRFVLGC